MTNFEYFKDEIIKLLVDGREMAVVDGEPIACKDTSCCMCDLKPNILKSCRECTKAWLNAEHIEKPKLTKKERQFCELVETGWIIRDIQGNLWCSKNKPAYIIDDEGCETWMSRAGILIDCRFPNCKFEFVKHDDKEPWSVEELLKLEYEHSEEQ